MALYYPGRFILQKFMALKALRDLYNLPKKQVSFKQRTKNTNRAVVVERSRASLIRSSHAQG